MHREISLHLPILKLDLASIMSTHFYGSKFALESFWGQVMSVFSSESLLKAGELGLLLTPELDTSCFENSIFTIAFYPDFF